MRGLLTHRDMGPRSRYLGSLVPSEELIWQDPVPPVTENSLMTLTLPPSRRQGSLLRALSGTTGVDCLGVGFDIQGQRQAGGANGARIRLVCRTIGRSTTRPNWRRSSTPDADPERVQRPQSGGKQVSLADLIVIV